jgi:hypothetical protein
MWLLRDAWKSLGQREDDVDSRGITVDHVIRTCFEEYVRQSRFDIDKTEGETITGPRLFDFYDDKVSFDNLTEEALIKNLLAWVTGLFIYSLQKYPGKNPLHQHPGVHTTIPAYSPWGPSGSIETWDYIISRLEIENYPILDNQIYPPATMGAQSTAFGCILCPYTNFLSTSHEPRSPRV